MRAAIYVRLSQDRQGLEAGVRRQEDDCRALVRRERWELAGVWSDNDTSASRYGRRKRVQYRAMLDEVQAGRVQVVVAYHPKRLVRQVRELEELIDLAEGTGVRFAFVQLDVPLDLNTATGRAMARIAAAFGAMESEEQSERIRRQRLQQVAEGRRHGGGKRPFGFEADGVTHLADEAEVIQEAAQRLIRGASVFSVVADWNRWGVRTPSGNRWTTATVAQLMTQPSLAGIRHHAPTGTRTTAAWEPIITPEEHELLRLRLRGSAGQGRDPRPARRTALLSGIVRCSECGRKLLAGAGRYVCDRGRGGGCGRVRVAQGRALELAILRIAQREWKSRRSRRRSRRSPRGDASRAAALVAELTAAEQRLRELAEMLGRGELGRQEYGAARQSAQREVERLTAELDAASPPDAAAMELADDAVVEWLRGDALEPAEVERMQGPLRELGEWLVSPGERYMRYDADAMAERVELRPGPGAPSLTASAARPPDGAPGSRPRSAAARGRSSRPVRARG